MEIFIYGILRTLNINRNNIQST